MWGDALPRGPCLEGGYFAAVLVQRRHDPTASPPPLPLARGYNGPPDVCYSRALELTRIRTSSFVSPEWADEGRGGPQSTEISWSSLRCRSDNHVSSEVSQDVKILGVMGNLRDKTLRL